MFHDYSGIHWWFAARQDHIHIVSMFWLAECSPTGATWLLRRLQRPTLGHDLLFLLTKKAATRETVWPFETHRFLKVARDSASGLGSLWMASGSLDFTASPSWALGKLHLEDPVCRLPQSGLQLLRGKAVPILELSDTSRTRENIWRLPVGPSGLQ